MPSSADVWGCCHAFFEHVCRSLRRHRAADPLQKDAKNHDTCALQLCMEAADGVHRLCMRACVLVAVEMPCLSMFSTAAVAGLESSSKGCTACALQCCRTGHVEVPAVGPARSQQLARGRSRGGAGAAGRTSARTGCVLASFSVRDVGVSTHSDCVFAGVCA
jgi:hypothetical protein